MIKMFIAFIRSLLVRKPFQSFNSKTKSLHSTIDPIIIIVGVLFYYYSYDYKNLNLAMFAMSIGLNLYKYQFGMSKASRILYIQNLIKKIKLLISAYLTELGTNNADKEILEVYYKSFTNIIKQLDLMKKDFFSDILGKSAPLINKNLTFELDFLQNTLMKYCVELEEILNILPDNSAILI